jgi:hypothetical protein
MIEMVDFALYLQRCKIIREDALSVNLVDSGIKIIEREEWEHCIETQATIIGTDSPLYPCYAFFKRFLSQALDTNNTLDTNNALVAAVRRCLLIHRCSLAKPNTYDCDKNF